ncbi:MAG: hypothetical protein V4553_10020 [Bacteroidota bacterium]
MNLSKPPISSQNILMADLVCERSLVDLINRDKYINVFNPSVYITDEMIYLTFRAFGFKKTQPFHSYLIKYNPVSNHKEEIDISEFCIAYNINICADPKLLSLDNDVWITFNTGYSTSFNSIYLLKVSGAISKPYECLLDGRKIVEKNWAFFKQDNLLQAIYSISPYRKIYLENLDEKTKTFNFKFAKDVNINLAGQTKQKKLSVGTQLLKVGQSYCLIAHEKIKIFNKIIYFGRFVSINGDKITIHPGRMFHSYKSLFGSWKKYNNKLISCSYFSGLAYQADDFIISYGINDTAFAIKRIASKQLWH